ncbi:MAG: hypothetical protein J6Z45_02495 [Oscillospiraceae bacterium]|nr:hypothetical protein [Oscillospiraceae bacterium]
MNFKNALRAGYAAAVIAALLLPAALMPFQKQDAGKENRTLAEKPSLKTGDGTLNRDFFADAEAWFSDHFALRRQLVTGYGSLTKSLFATSSEPDVFIGKDGWLFYAETLPDLLNEQRLTESELRHVVRTLELMRNYCAANGAELIFACAPNKGSIYPEQLPSRILPGSGPNTLDALNEALFYTNVKNCGLKKLLRSAAETADFPLYHRLDTHWNGDGAMLAYNALMKAAGLDDRGFSDAPRTVSHDFSGDLQTMLLPDSAESDDNPVYAVPQTYQTLGHYRGIDDMTIRTECADGEGTLLMFRDSFGRALIPLLSQRFASCTYSRAEEMPLDLIRSQQTDVVICEIVERNLPRLLLHAPHMEAPAVQLETEAVRQENTAPLNAVCREYGGYLHLYGTFDEQFGDNTAVYCTVTLPDGSQQSYEAFPCFEQDLLQAEQHGANGFSVYLPAETVPAGTAALISAVCGNVRYLTGETVLAPAEETPT